jgi:diaminopimelate epimerase
VIERNERFQPQGTNVEFVRVDGRDELTMRVWERGVGETLSCGTGACAAAAVAHRRGLVDDRICMRVSGGELDIVVGETVRLGGPVVHIFDMDVEVGS